MSATPTLERPEPTAETDTLPTTADACPTCDGALVDGQGLVACTDCDWTGLYE
jgi:hypothetical protein